MADVKICDRCGKTIAATMTQRITCSTWRYSLFTPDVSRGLQSNWDLCTDCGRKLERFLKGEELVRDAQGSNEGSAETVKAEVESKPAPTVQSSQASRPANNAGNIKKRV